MWSWWRRDRQCRLGALRRLCATGTIARPRPTCAPARTGRSPGMRIRVPAASSCWWRRRSPPTCRWRRWPRCSPSSPGMVEKPASGAPPRVARRRGVLLVTLGLTLFRASRRRSSSLRARARCCSSTGWRRRSRSRSCRARPIGPMRAPTRPAVVYRSAARCLRGGVGGRRGARPDRRRSPGAGPRLRRGDTGRFLRRQHDRGAGGEGAARAWRSTLTGAAPRCGASS